MRLAVSRVAITRLSRQAASQPLLRAAQRSDVEEPTTKADRFSF
jgi:hypothetical protein